MSCLPNHGRVDCTLCYKYQPIDFDKTRRIEANWRITANPLAWGSTAPEVVVLGFSKGPTQAGALAGTPHDKIAFKGSRGNVGKILTHVGLLPQTAVNQNGQAVDRLLSETSGRFHFGSLIRCTVERFDQKADDWKGSGGGMLDKFVATQFGREVATQCATKFLGSLPATTKLVIMFGLGSNLNYVHAAFELYKVTRSGNWRKLNEVSYTDGKITVVHVEHFASQGALIPDWLGVTNKPRARLGLLAQESTGSALLR